MGEALAEAGPRSRGASDPMPPSRSWTRRWSPARHDRVHESDDPTAHAVDLALREAARRVGKDRLREATIFCTMEPCPMCVGAMLAADVEALVFAVPNREAGAAGTLVQLADHPALRRRIKVVSGIRRDEVEELYAAFAR